MQSWDLDTQWNSKIIFCHYSSSYLKHRSYYVCLRKCPTTRDFPEELVVCQIPRCPHWDHGSTVWREENRGWIELLVKFCFVLARGMSFAEQLVRTISNAFLVTTMPAWTNCCVLAMISRKLVRKKRTCISSWKLNLGPLQQSYNHASTQLPTQSNRGDFLFEQWRLSTLNTLCMNLLQ